MKKPVVGVAKEKSATRLQSFPSGILSRLSLFPGSRAHPRMIAVMIENHEEARRYHSGLTDALMIQEFLVEGFISRFVALFDTRHLPREVGPVRSLRPYFLDGISPWARTVFHAGGSPEALKRVEEGNEFYATNILYYDDENDSLRKDGPPAPHDLFLRKAKIKEFLSEVPERFLGTSQWPPYTIGPAVGGESATNIRVSFFNKLHNVFFEFQPLSQKYERTNGDSLSKARPSNVLILEVPIDEVGAYGRLFMTLTGSGQAELFHSGKVWTGRWKRESITDPFTIVNLAGEQLPFAQGQTWMMVLPTLERVSWK
jgi:hypothetical protein